MSRSRLWQYESNRERSRTGLLLKLPEAVVIPKRRVLARGICFRVVIPKRSEESASELSFRSEARNLL